MSLYANTKMGQASLMRSMFQSGAKIKTAPIKGGTIALSGKNNQLTVTHK
jgi:hypothetical protein